MSYQGYPWNNGQASTYQQNGNFMSKSDSCSGNQWQTYPDGSIPRSMHNFRPNATSSCNMTSIGSIGNMTAPLECPKHYFSENENEPVLENGEAFACYTGMDLSNGIGQNGPSNNFW